MENKLLIAVAGAGKTTYLVDEALKSNGNILITTYTKSNENEIKDKFFHKNGCIPSNVEIMAWFEFLLRHGVRPFQGAMHESLYEKNIGFFMANKKSALYVREDNTLKYFFAERLRIYSDRVANFVVKCNANLNGKIVTRMENIYSHIFIDEIQDLVGYDLIILKLLMESNLKLLMVGDPRQATYSTHPSDKYSKYKHGKIVEFVSNEINKKQELCKIDSTTLNQSHRNNDKICSFSSMLFPDLPVSKTCNCSLCRNYADDHIGVFLLHKNQASNYLKKFVPVQLRWSKKTKTNNNYTALNFGDAKGLSFDRVVIYPTADMEKWIMDNSVKLAEETRAKFYVAITRARKSVAIVVDDKFINHNFSFWSSK